MHPWVKNSKATAHPSAHFPKENCTYWMSESSAVLCQGYNLSSAGVSLILLPPHTFSPLFYCKWTTKACSSFTTQVTLLYLVEHTSKPWIKGSIDTCIVACTEWKALKYCKIYVRSESLSMETLMKSLHTDNKQLMLSTDVTDMQRCSLTWTVSPAGNSQ